jgi:cobalt/nickel transport system permease protein
MSTRRSTRFAVVGGLLLLVALALAAFASPFASSAPDGLNKVAIDKQFDHTAKASAVDDSPLAGYAVENVSNDKVSKGLSGVSGVLITLAVGGIVFGGVWFVARRRASSSTAAA